MTDSRTLQEVVCALHFVALPLTVRDLSAWSTDTQEQGGTFQQLPPLPPAQLFAAGQTQSITFNVLPPLPRVLVRNADDHGFSIFQSDRVGFGWRRTEPLGETTPYPGFDVLKADWIAGLQHFFEWSEERLGSPCAPRFMELTYVNGLPLMEEEGSEHAVPSYLRPLAMGPRRMVAMQLAWRELVPDTNGGQVAALAALGQMPPAKSALLFNFNGLAPLAAPQIGDAAIALDKLHAYIQDMYRSTIETVEL